MKTAHAVAPSAYAAAPPVQRKVGPMSETQEAPQRLLTSLTSVPAVQRKCSSCEAEEQVKTMPVQPRLEVGPVDDPYEREADAIAGRVMAMREPGPATPADGVVQRACAACSSKSDEVQRAPALTEELTRDDEQTPRMRATPGVGGDHISASANQLTSGGAALSEQTRSFYEARMGRDLSDVRVHRGSGSDTLNQSISARAFTFQDHIWLNGSEPDTPSFTMAHELAHVLQQTQPGEVRPRPVVRRAPSEIISETLYFAPEDTTFEAMHGDAISHAVSQNSNLMGEIRVPNANRKGQSLIQTGVTPGSGFGYADLVLGTSTKLWGLGFVETQQGTAPWPWYVTGSKTPLQPQSLTYSTKGKMYIGGKALSGASAKQKYFNESAPRWRATDFIRDASTAPDSYEIADMKFAGDKERAADASKQTDSYARGFNFAKENYNRIVNQSDQVAAGSTTVNRTGSSAMSPKTTGFSASQMTSSVGHTDFVSIAGGLKLKLRKYGTTILGNPKWEDVSGFTYTGKAYYRQNSGTKHLWEYVFWPDAIKEQDDSVSRANRRDKLTNASQTLYDQMVASPTGKKVMPLRTATHAAPPRVQRAKPKKKLPPQADPFQAQYATWKTQQKSFTKTFSGFTGIKSGTGKADVAKLAFDTAMQNTVKVLGGKAPGGTAPSLNTTALATAQKEFNQAELIEGRSGRMLGAMRTTFGATFVKALNIYERLKTKFAAFLKGAKKRTGGGKIGKTIMKVGGVIFGTIFKVMLPQIGAYLVDCVEQGFKALMKRMMEVDFSQYTDALEQSITKKYEEIAAQIEAKVEAAAEAIKARFAGIYEAVMDKWETARTLVTIAKHVFNVARAASCAAGGLASAGISCVVAGVDYVLSLFNASPSEHLLSHMLSSCVAQKLIAKFILGRAIIRNLPREISETIRTNVKDILPAEVKPLICDSITDTPDLPDKSELPCEDIDNPGGPNRGSDLSKPPPEFPPHMNQRRATKKEIKQHGRLDKAGVLDESGNVDESKLPEELKKLLKSENAPPPGTPEVWDPPDGSSAPKVRVQEPETAEPKKPKVDPGQTTDPDAGEGASGGGQKKQSIRRGKIKQPTGQWTGYVTILPGPSGGFSYGKKNGRTLFNVFIWIQTSELQAYGPSPVQIKVWDVVKKRSGDWIEYELVSPYVLDNGSGTTIDIDETKSWARLRSDR